MDAPGFGTHLRPAPARGRSARLWLFVALVVGAVAALAFVRVPLPFDAGVFFAATVEATGEHVRGFAPTRPSNVSWSADASPCVLEASRAGATAIIGRARGGHEAPARTASTIRLRVGGRSLLALRCDPLPRGIADRALLLGDPNELPAKERRPGRLFYVDGSARADLRIAAALFESGGSRTLADAFRQVVDQTGAWGGVFFVAMFVVATVMAFPATVLTVAGAMGFGFWKGFLLVWLGANAGALAAFLVGRYLARDFVQRHLPERLRSFDARLSARGFTSVVLMRLLPVLPFLAINYACALSAIRARDFILGTALGTVPLLFLFVYAASTAWRISLSDPATWLPLLAALPVLATPWLWRRVWHRVTIDRSADGQ